MNNSQGEVSSGGVIVWLFGCLWHINLGKSELFLYVYLFYVKIKVMLHL